MYVDIMCKMARSADVLSVAEMLPTPEQNWLVERDGARYTSELRVAAVDPEAWQLPGPDTL